ncbi:MAG: hypothetical protein AAFX03_06030 [Pseudomonadota bacterium]
MQDEDEDSEVERRTSRVFAVLFAAAAGLIAMLNARAYADVTHAVRFAAPARILVWAEGGAPVPAADRAAPEALIAGVLDPAGAAVRFEDLADGRVMASFYVASNTAFAVEARLAGAASDPALLGGVRVEASADAAGAAAQAPHSAGPTAGGAPALTLADLTAGARVFTGDRRTALRPGAPRSQAARVDVVFSGPGAHLARSVRFDISVP